MKYFLLLAIPAVVGLSILSKPLLKLFTTPEFETGAMIIPFIALSALFAGVFQIVINITLLTRRTQYNVLIQFVAALSNLLMNIAFIPLFGLMGAAYSNLISFLIMAGLSIYICFKFLTFDFNVRFIFKSLFASFLMGCVVVYINPQTILGLFVALCSGIIAYFIVIILTKGLNNKELKMFKDLIP